jgi:hypothetical protein
MDTPCLFVTKSELSAFKTQAIITNEVQPLVCELFIKKSEVSAFCNCLQTIRKLTVVVHPRIMMMASEMVGNSRSFAPLNS